MTIFIPVDDEVSDVFVFVQTPHNHPTHPRVNPSSSERRKLKEAIAAAGPVGLTAQKLLAGKPSFSSGMA
jgi:hypothetical protein